MKNVLESAWSQLLGVQLGCAPRKLWIHSEHVTETEPNGQDIVQPLISQGDNPSVEPGSPEETFNDQHQYWTEGSTEADMVCLFVGV